MRILRFQYSRHPPPLPCIASNALWRQNEIPMTLGRLLRIVLPTCDPLPRNLRGFRFPLLSLHLGSLVLHPSHAHLRKTCARGSGMLHRCSPRAMLSQSLRDSSPSVMKSPSFSTTSRRHVGTSRCGPSILKARICASEDRFCWKCSIRVNVESYLTTVLETHTIH